MDVGHGNHGSLTTMGRINLTKGGSLGFPSIYMSQTAKVVIGHSPGLFAKVHPLRISRLVELWSHQAEGSLLGMETNDFIDIQVIIEGVHFRSMEEMLA